MAIGIGANANANAVGTKEYYSGVLAEARAIYNENGVGDMQTALLVFVGRELQKVREKQTEFLERLDRLTAANSAAVQSENEQTRRGRPRKGE